MVCGAGLLTHVGRPAPSNGIHANRPHPNTSGGRAISPKAPLRAPARVAAFQVTSTPDGPLGDRSLPGELFGLHSRVLPPTQPDPNTSGGRAISPKAPLRAPTRVAAFQVTSTPDGPLGNRSLPGELFGLHSGVLPPTRPHPNTSEVGRFLRKRRPVHLPVLQHSKSPALATDRSEIGPYLRGLRLRFRGVSRPWRERHACERGRRQHERPH